MTGHHLLIRNLYIVTVSNKFNTSHDTSKIYIPIDEHENFVTARKEPAVECTQTKQRARGRVPR